jgi:hypothetical protein
VVRISFHRNDLFGLVCAGCGLKWNKRLILRSLRVPSRGNCLTSCSSRPLPEYISDNSRGDSPATASHHLTDSATTLIQMNFPFSCWRWKFMHYNIGFAATLRNTTQCSLVEVHWRFWGMYCLHLHSRSVSEASNQSNISRLFCDGYVIDLSYFFYLKMEIELFAQNSGEL